MARPSKYEAEWQYKLIVIEGWARDGLTNEQIAKNIGISVKTLYEWQNKYSEFREALKRGKDVVDCEVENALLKRALGYEYEEITRELLYNSTTGERLKDEDGNPLIVVTKIVKKQVKPDTTAQIFWLKNRKPKEWRDKQEYHHTGSMPTVNSKLELLSVEELRKLAYGEE